jgi:hypothetical protein
MSASAKVRDEQHHGNVRDVVDGGYDASSLAGNLETLLNGRQTPAAEILDCLHCPFPMAFVSKTAVFSSKTLFSTSFYEEFSGKKSDFF